MSQQQRGQHQQGQREGKTQMQAAFKRIHDDSCRNR
jgi:hypothetical protein